MTSRSQPQPFHEMLRYLRNLRGLTQAELGRGIDASGSLVSLWERNKIFPKDANVRRIASHLKLDQMTRDAFYETYDDASAKDAERKLREKRSRDEKKKVDPEKATELVEEARRHKNQEQYRRAYELIREAHGLNPNDRQIRKELILMANDYSFALLEDTKLGSILNRNRKLSRKLAEDALEVLEPLRGMDETNGWFHCNLSVAYHWTESTDKAIQEAEEAVRDEPNYPTFRFELARRYQEKDAEEGKSGDGQYLEKSAAQIGRVYLDGQAQNDDRLCQEALGSLGRLVALAVERSKSAQFITVRLASFFQPFGWNTQDVCASIGEILSLTQQFIQRAYDQRVRDAGYIGPGEHEHRQQTQEVTQHVLDAIDYRPGNPHYHASQAVQLASQFEIKAKDEEYLLQAAVEVAKAYLNRGADEKASWAIILAFGALNRVTCSQRMRNLIVDNMNSLPDFIFVEFLLFCIKEVAKSKGMTPKQWLVSENVSLRDIKGKTSILESFFFGGNNSWDVPNSYRADDSAPLHCCVRERLYGIVFLIFIVPML